MCTSRRTSSRRLRRRLAHLRVDRRRGRIRRRRVRRQPLFAFVSLYQGGKKLYETPPKSIVPSATSRLGTMPLTFDLGVDTLPRGEYDCQVTILDPSTQKAAFWKSPIKLVQ